MLYDLVEDPYQLNNRINDPSVSEMQAEMHRILTRHLKESEDPFYYAYRGEQDDELQHKT